MIGRNSHNSKLVSSVLCASRSRQKEPPVATEVRKVRQPRAGLRRLPSVPSGTEQPVAGTLRPQVQEGQEELQLQVNATRAVCFLLEYLKTLERCLVSPLLCIDSIYIFSLFIVGSSLDGFPRSIRRAFNFQRHNRKCHLLPFDRFTHGAQRQPNGNFTLYEKKGTLCRGLGSARLRCRRGRAWVWGGGSVCLSCSGCLVFLLT